MLPRLASPVPRFESFGPGAIGPGPGGATGGPRVTSAARPPAWRRSSSISTSTSIVTWAGTLNRVLQAVLSQLQLVVSGELTAQLLQPGGRLLAAEPPLVLDLQQLHGHSSGSGQIHIVPGPDRSCDRPCGPRRAPGPDRNGRPEPTVRPCRTSCASPTTTRSPTTAMSPCSPSPTRSAATPSRVRSWPPSSRPSRASGRATAVGGHHRRRGPGVLGPAMTSPDMAGAALADAQELFATCERMMTLIQQVPQVGGGPGPGHRHRRRAANWWRRVTWPWPARRPGSRRPAARVACSAHTPLVAVARDHRPEEGAGAGVDRRPDRTPRPPVPGGW